jgi:hypothetical protein
MTTAPAPAETTPRHTVAIVASPKMDTPSLVAAKCTCGNYRSGPTSESDARQSGRQHVAAAVLNDAWLILTTGLTWLYNTAQPADAVISHHGVYRGTPDRGFRFLPGGYGHLGRSPIVTVEVHPVFNGRGDVTNPLTREDVTALTANLRRRGHTIRETWNGKGRSTVSVALDGTVHPTLTAAVTRYHAACPTHYTVFCYRDGCTWYADGYARIVEPAWTETPA